MYSVITDNTIFINDKHSMLLFQPHKETQHLLAQRRLCLYTPQMKSPHKSHQVGWAWLQGRKSWPSPVSSTNCGTVIVSPTSLMIRTRFKISGNFPGLILKALTLSNRGVRGRKESVSSIRSSSSSSSINSPNDMIFTALLYTLK